MRFAVIALASLVITSFVASTAEARKLCFGVDEDLRTIQKVDVKGPEGESLNLARKIRMDCFVLPYTVSDDGYVLAKEDGKSYFSLSEDQISQFQQQGTLPTPLPPFELSTLDFVFGYSLWLVILFVVGWGVIDWLRKPKGDETG